MFHPYQYASLPLLRRAQTHNTIGYSAQYQAPYALLLASPEHIGTATLGRFLGNFGLSESSCGFFHFFLAQGTQSSSLTRMKKTKKASLAALIASTSIPERLVRAVVRQLGGWQSFTESAPDICRGGIDGGFHGFIYHKDTESFARQHLDALNELLSAQAQEIGFDSTFQMIRGFGCFKDETLTDGDLMRALCRGKNPTDGPNILNVLAWYAGEEVAQAYCDAFDPQYERRSMRCPDVALSREFLLGLDRCAKFCSWTNGNERKESNQMNTTTIGHAWHLNPDTGVLHVVTGTPAHGYSVDTYVPGVARAIVRERFQFLNDAMRELGTRY